MSISFDFLLNYRKNLPYFVKNLTLNLRTYGERFFIKTIDIGY